jgi:2-polyprenyl-6-methoxyphenol hydroxylase-like FAD-dependent oxidoreductase
MSLSEEDFNADIQQRFENRLGSMKLTGKLYPYPLVAVLADKFAATRYALIGDAAVGMHPVTAHGFNLGLRGQDTLAEEITRASSKGKDIGTMDVLKRYESKHMRVSRPLYFGTNAMVSMFTNDVFPARVLRKLVLRVANNIGPVKSMITNRLTEMENSPWPQLPFSR